MRYDHEPSLFCVTPVYFAIVLPPKTVMQSVSLAILQHEYGVKPSGIFEKCVDITGFFGDIRDEARHGKAFAGLLKRYFGE